MENVQFIKFRALIGVSLLVLCYPTILLIAVSCKLYQSIFGKKSPKDITGEIAVITGGACGLGKEIAIELASKGCHVAIADVNLEQAEETANHIRESFSVKARAYKIDVSDYEQVIQLSKNVSTDLGNTTILINNAGILLLSQHGNPYWRNVQNMINVNLTSHFWTQQAFLPQMKEQQKGHIVAISSASSFFPLQNNAVYTTTKYGIRGLMRVLRLDLKSSGFENIHATTVFPNFLQTNEKVANIVRKAGWNKVFPLISGKEAANSVVNAMLLNEEEVVLPSFYALVYRCFEILPASWQDWVLLAPSLMTPGKQTK